MSCGESRPFLAGMSVVASLLLIAVWGCGRRGPATTAPETSDLREQPTNESWGTEMYISNDAVPMILIRSPHTREFEREDSTVTILSRLEDQRVEAQIFDEQGRPSAHLTADEIRYVEEHGTFEAFGAVVVETETNKRLESEHLSWVEETRRIHTPGFVRIFTPRENIQGYQFESDEDLSDYSLARVTGQVITEEDDRAVDLSADRLQGRREAPDEE